MGGSSCADGADPILGIVVLRLEEAFREKSQFTRWYPLVGGLGWGRIRISLLWKPIDIVLPPRISGFEVATMQIKSITSTNMTQHSDRPISMVIETEADKYTLNPGENAVLDPWRSTGTVNEVSSPVHRRVTSGADAGPGTPGSTRSAMTAATDDDDAAELEWEVNRPIHLAVEYRHSCSVLVSFVARKRLKKKKTIGLALIRLSDCEDMTDIQKTVPVFGTTDVGQAVKASHRYAKLSDNDAASIRQESRHVRARPSISSRASGSEIPLLGFVSLSFVLHPGVGRAHRKLGKKDLRFRRVYEAWEVSQDIELGLDKVRPGDTVRQAKDSVLKHNKKEGDGDGDGGSSSGSDSDDESEDDEEDDGPDDLGGAEGSETKRFMAERRSHSAALHRRVSQSCLCLLCAAQKRSNDEADTARCRTRASSSSRLHERASLSKTNWPPSCTLEPAEPGASWIDDREVPTWTSSRRVHPSCSPIIWCLYTLHGSYTLVFDVDEDWSSSALLCRSS